VEDLTGLLEAAALPQGPVRGPFGPSRDGLPLPGQVTYPGGGTVRLDETAISSLTSLADGEDFKADLTDAGPVLTVGADAYLAREEPGPKPATRATLSA
jgi:hypothetical protein